MRFLLICAGGAVGTGARYLLSGWALRAFGPSFPAGTLAVNVLGSFLIALVMHVGVETAAVPPALRVALATGVLGGFTTYSTFNHETLAYLRESAWLLAAANVAATVLGCLVAGVLGLAAARWIAGH